jgi:uncharacterized membrane protein YccF (DUF307 family)
MIGNILWLVLAGLWLTIGYVLAGLLAFVLIVTIPFGVGRSGWRTSSSGRSVGRRPGAVPRASGR